MSKENEIIKINMYFPYIEAIILLDADFLALPKTVSQNLQYLNSALS